eukprot:scaffold1484_cov173-Amphora_coffeaeformis.AAC.7
MRCALWLVVGVIFCGVAFAQEDESCRQGQENGDEDPTEKMEDALRRLVAGYVRAEKASYEAVLKDVNLIVQDKLPPETVEEVVAEAVDDKSLYADRLILDMLETVSDPDCMSREFDTSEENFDASEAAMVFHKCKVLVLRNVFDKEFLEEYKANFTAYIRGLDTGRISKTGETTNNEDYFMDMLDHGRWEVLVPKKQFARKEIIQNVKVLKVMMDERLLGDSLVLHSMGAAIADSGANPQDFHTDSDYIFSEALYETTGVTHHELPAYAITMMVPLLYMTPDHGPTEFCIGSSNLAGLNEDKEKVKLRDESLRPHLYDQPDLEKIDDTEPCKYMRTPLITFGDVLLFDYQIIHRGGRNKSLDLSRFWYKDQGFEEEVKFIYEDDDEEEDEEEEDPDPLYRQLTKTARFAIPDELDEKDTDGSLLSDEEAELEKMRRFRGLPVRELQQALANQRDNS